MLVKFLFSLNISHQKFNVMFRCTCPWGLDLSDIHMCLSSAPDLKLVMEQSKKMRHNLSAISVPAKPSEKPLAIPVKDRPMKSSEKPSAGLVKDVRVKPSEVPLAGPVKDEPAKPSEEPLV
jgi:hypothetical protein